MHVVASVEGTKPVLQVATAQYGAAGALMSWQFRDQMSGGKEAHHTNLPPPAGKSQRNAR